MFQYSILADSSEVLGSFFKRHAERVVETGLPGWGRIERIEVGDMAPVLVLGRNVCTDYLRWGFSDEGVIIPAAESTGKLFARRCLVPVTRFSGRSDISDGQAWTFEVEGSDWFMAGATWNADGPKGPGGFAILTCPAGPDLAHLNSWQPVVVEKRDWLDWLRPDRDTRHNQMPSPAGRLLVEAV